MLLTFSRIRPLLSKSLLGNLSLPPGPNAGDRLLALSGLDGGGGIKGGGRGAGVNAAGDPAVESDDETDGADDLHHGGGYAGGLGFNPDVAADDSAPFGEAPRNKFCCSVECTSNAGGGGTHEMPCSRKPP